MTMTAPIRNPIFESLSTSHIFKDYQEAFTSATNLPLSLAAPGENPLCMREDPKASPFCALMARTNFSCAACDALQQRLKVSAGLQPNTLKCFAGLCETAVPVRVGENLVAFLHTGHILVEHPDQARFSRVAKELLRLGTEIDMKKAEEAWYATRVLSKDQYDSMIRLLTIFARHLAICGNSLHFDHKRADPPSVRQARKIIDIHYQDELTLGMVAKSVNVSANYFSELFKKATGINFVEYVARVRVEKAKNLLENPDLRVSEIAYEVGFQSLSQFNRVFKKQTGMTPSAARSIRLKQ